MVELLTIGAIQVLLPFLSFSFGYMSSGFEVGNYIRNPLDLRHVHTVQQVEDMTNCVFGHLSRRLMPRTSNFAQCHIKGELLLVLQHPGPQFWGPSVDGSGKFVCAVHY